MSNRSDDKVGNPKTDHQLTIEMAKEGKLFSNFFQAVFPLLKKLRKAYKPAEAGMITIDHQSLVWRYIYLLRKLDEKPMLHEDGTPVTPGERMAGAIRAILDNNMVKPGKDIFERVHFDEGERLIEGLKRYVKSAERKAKRRENNENR
ncbi:MAG: hypothetical protein K2N26_07390 [Oscillospiraceae bacterium]|nr:hypothetical protein [Oscillospiraceae bacterium]